MTAMYDTQELVDRYLARYDKQSTRDAVAGDLQQWLDWCHGAEIDPLAVSEADACAYRDHLSDRYARNSVNRKMASASGFCKWLVCNELVTVNVFGAVKRPDAEDSVKRWISPAELVRFCQAAGHESDTALALAVLCAKRGLRISEALTARWEHLTWQGKVRTLVVMGKTGERTVALAKGDMRRLNRLPHREGLIVRNANGDQMRAATAARLVRRVARMARIPHPETMTPHVLRRSAAMYWLEQSNGNIWAVSKLLGHASIHTTARYLEAWQQANNDVLAIADAGFDELEDPDFEPQTPAEVASTLWQDLPRLQLTPLPEAA